MLTTVLLYGSLGKRFGRRFKLNVHTPKEIVDALSIRFPNFRQAILEMEDVDFGVKVGKKQISGDRLAFPSYGKTVTITPVVRGSANSKGWIQVIAGVVLIAGGIIFSKFLGPFAPTVIGLGISLVLGGVAQLLAPSPATQSDTESKTRPSYQFGTIVNTVGNGQCVPVFYGGDEDGMWIGSNVASAEYESVPISQGSTSGGTTSNVGLDQAGRPIYSTRDYFTP